MPTRVTTVNCSKVGTKGGALINVYTMNIYASCENYAKGTIATNNVYILNSQELI